jgi:hypothetical protein
VQLDAQGRVTSRTVRKTPVVSPSQLSALPFGQVLVFRRGMPPVVGRAGMVWDRADVRRHQHGPALAARLARALLAVLAWPVRAITPPAAFGDAILAELATYRTEETAVPTSTARPLPQTFIDLGQLADELRHDLRAAGDPGQRVTPISDGIDRGVDDDDAVAS